MRLSLICGANPRVAKDGPSVRVLAGTWRIEGDGVKFTTYSVFLDDVRVENIHDDVVMEKPGIMRVVFDTRSDEKCISIWARRIA